MNIEKFRKLSKEEVNGLEVLLTQKLSPMKAVVKITDNPVIISMGIRHGGDWTEWNEYLYEVSINCKYGQFKFSEPIPIAVQLENLIWNFIYRVWDELYKVPNINMNSILSIWKV